MLDVVIGVGQGDAVEGQGLSRGRNPFPFLAVEVEDLATLATI